MSVVENHQQKPSIADDAELLDSLLELDRGMGHRDPVDDQTTRPSLKAPVRPEPAEELRSAEPLVAPVAPVAPLGSLAARRRPWRTPLVASRPDAGPPPPTVGERARGPSIGDAPGPSLPPSRHHGSLAEISPVSPEPADSSGAPDASVTYESFYGLDEKPFSSSSDPKFIYHSASFDRATQDLIDALARREPIMVVTGENGTGKTTLCLSLVGEIGGSTRPCFLTDPPASVRELFEAVRGSAVVVIDEAQRLSVDVLQQLYRLSEGGRGGERLQIVLVGEPELLTLLPHGRVRGVGRRVRTRCRLEALMADEVGSYLAHRLAIAGAKARIEFDEDAVAALFARSGGVPRVINLVADRALVEAHRIPVRRIDKTLVDTAADHLGLPVPGFGVRSMALAISTLVAIVVLSLIGAAAAAWVFRDDLERAIIEWETRPAVPAAPPHELLPPVQPTPPAE